MNMGLGTAQFGLAYGISNRDGQTPETEARGILSGAATRGFTLIDTAAQYGTSEAVIGRCLPAGHRFRIVTKTPTYEKAALDDGDALRLDAQFRASLRYLGQRTLYGLMIHHAEDLLAENGVVLWRAMQNLKAAGGVEKIGVSLYTPEQLDAVVASFPVDLVQVPVNVLDQRLVRSGRLKRLKQAGVEVHARSIFLQGLLLMDPGALAGPLARAREVLTRYRGLARDRGLTPLEAALAYVNGVGEIDAVIVGVNNARQLDELCAAGRRDRGATPLDFAEFAVDDERIIDPRRWQ